MDDKRIIELFFARDEQAIELTKEKYGRHLSSLALKILGKRGAAEECENDTYLAAWNAMPPHRPAQTETPMRKTGRTALTDTTSPAREIRISMRSARP